MSAALDNRRPVPLLVAAAVTGIEALAYVAAGIAEWVAYDPAKPVVAVSTGIFFVAFGAFLGFCAYRFWNLRSWARAPIVTTQLIQIPVGISFWGGDWKPLAAVILAVSALVTACMFHPATIAAVEDAEDAED